MFNITSSHGNSVRQYFPEISTQCLPMQTRNATMQHSPWHVHLGIGTQPEQKLFDHPRHSTFFCRSFRHSDNSKDVEGIHILNDTKHEEMNVQVLSFRNLVSAWCPNHSSPLTRHPARVPRPHLHRVPSQPRRQRPSPRRLSPRTESGRRRLAR